MSQEKINLRELKKSARALGILTDGLSREMVEYEIEKKNRGKSPERKRHTVGKQLGIKGSHGSVVAVQLGRKLCAKKQFRANRSNLKIKREIQLQREAAAAGVSPRIIEYNLNSKYIIMQRLCKNLWDVLRKKGGKMSKKLQREILQIFRILDNIGVFHKDPNPLNFMLDATNTLYIIDFGFATRVDIKRDGKTPNQNQMTLGLLMKLSNFFPGVEYPILKNSLPQHLSAMIQTSNSSIEGGSGSMVDNIS